MKSLEHALTFDDILLLPKYSECIPTEVDTTSFFAKDICLKTPLLSAAMDTVTENDTARVIAQNGGLGVIHKNMSITSQAKQVTKVKKYESGLIQDPFTLEPENKIHEALKIMKKHSFSGIPITSKGHLVGILTNRDLCFEINENQKIKDVMTKDNLVTTLEGTTLEEAKKILYKHRIEKLPVVDKQGKLKGLITIKDIQKSKKYPQSLKDKLGRLLVGAALGVGDDETKRAQALVEAEVDVLVVDTAHGHSKNVFKMIRHLRKNYSDKIIVGGNVATKQACEDLFKEGVDVVKVGIGPGSICTTRIVSGVGVPQFYAVLQCVEVARKLGKSIIADGGIRYSGDITKIIAAGANSVMVGSLFAGCDESPGEMVIYQGRTYKLYRGMGSLGAMKKGSKDRYFQQNVEEEDFIPEGVEGRVSYKGSLTKVLHQLSGGLKTGMGYVGASHIKELQERAEFIKISSEGLKESHVHGIHVTKQAPNYQF